MIRRLIFYVFLITIISSQVVPAQNRWEKFGNRFDRDRFHWYNWHSDSQPYIELNYGLGSPKQKNISSDFSDIGLAELKLGYISVDYYDHHDIIELDEKYFFGSKLSADLMSKDEDANEINTDLWRFGFGRKEGYGYDFGTVSLIPYLQYSYVWSKLETKNRPGAPQLLVLTPAQVLQDNNILDRYEGDFRFGTSSEAGIRVDFAKTIGLNASYETSVIFPRHLVWKHAGSFAIEKLGLGFIDYFVEEIMDSSPVAVPIMNFLLKGGYSYAFYKLKSEKMNWPFNTETPLTYETIKFGLTFSF